MSDKVGDALTTVNVQGGHPQLRAVIDRLHAKALRAAEKALLEAGEEGYDGTGDIKWNDAPIRVRLGALLACKAMDHAREEDVGRQQFGLLVLRERIKDPKTWESYAQSVDASKPPALGATTTTIDAEVTEPPAPTETK